MRRRDLVALLGAAITWPAGARGQQSIPEIGFLSTGSSESDNIPGRLIAFRKGLVEMGYAEGQNVAIEYRWAESQYDRLPALATNLGDELLRLSRLADTHSANEFRDQTSAAHGELIDIVQRLAR
jgi:putative ABC transport system substrate-binding protein